MSNNTSLFTRLCFAAQDNLCNPSPCGENAECLEGKCSCHPEYQGDPYSGCRPECLQSSECNRNEACINNKCRNPCPGTCAINAECNVVNHIPMCSCPERMTGNAFVECRPVTGIFFVSEYYNFFRHIH